MEIGLQTLLKCPKCGSTNFELIREATYLYTYDLDSINNESWLTKEASYPFLFNNREQIKEEETLKCKNCSSAFPCSLNKDNKEMKLIILQKAIRSDFQENPQFLG
ncbi:hypothetical protein [Candidatus Clostridium stratigraminis]|uniref:Uncharacterized protein n=1 Tax=Candidatus Clostridium stratigraminis TaxID=3381661 RepID=A0ABW8T5N5_9CLOT